jgi:ketosteroid isomerase-like protein
MSQENVEVVRRLLGALQEAWGRRGNVDDAFDSAAAFDSVDDDVEWIPAPEVPGPASYRGRDGFVEFMRAWTEDFEDWSIHLERLIDAGDNRVVAIQHQSASGPRVAVSDSQIATART